MLNLLAAPVFGPKHLLGLLYVVVLVVAGLQLLGKEPSKKKLLILIIMFFVFEILKLGFLIIRDGSFPMNHLPLHLCSMPLYIFPIIYFVKDESKIRKYALATGFVTVLGAAIAAMLLPENIIGSNNQWIPFTDNFLPWVSFTYHGLMILAAAWLLKSKTYVPEYKDVFRVMPFTFGLMILAIIANTLLDRDFMLLNNGTGSPLVGLLENGQLVYTLGMITTGLIVLGIISAITTSIYRIFKGK